jgi:hypothetical protein
LDNDGYVEIISATSGGVIYAINHDGSLYRMFSTGRQVEDSSPAVGDLDNDGDLEIVAATKGGYIYVWHHDGTIVSGWPLKPSGTLGVNGPSPALGDLDGDGDLEIVLTLHSGGDDLYAWHHDGSLLYSKNMPSGSGNIISSPVLVDLDGDGLLETLIHDEYGPGGSRLSIIDSAGSVLNSVFFTASSSISTPAVGDIDGDGTPEIVVLSQGGLGKIHVFTVTDGSFDIESSPWPMYHRDARNTGMQSPVGNINSPSTGSSFNNTETITFNGSGFCIEGGLTYSWHSSLDGNIGNGATVNTDVLNIGVHNIWLHVEDSNGRSDDSNNITIAVKALLYDSLDGSPPSDPNDGGNWPQGETVNLTGSEWGINQEIRINVTDPYGNTVHDQIHMANENGNFVEELVPFSSNETGIFLVHVSTDDGANWVQYDTFNVEPLQPEFPLGGSLAFLGAGIAYSLMRRRSEQKRLNYKEVKNAETF